jgi:hypothetical protein
VEVLLPNKKCSKCGKIKSVTNFHKDRQKKDGLAVRCKVCVSEDGRDFREKAVGRPLVEKKTCSKCGVEKLAIDFHKSSNHKGGLRPHCKECTKTIRKKPERSLFVDKKVCHQCGEEKSISSFALKSWSRDGYRSTCKKCINETRKRVAVSLSSAELALLGKKQRLRLRSLKIEFVEFLGGVCMRDGCGETTLFALDAHHTEYPFGREYGHVVYTKLLKGMYKAGQIELVCANCHRELCGSHQSIKTLPRKGEHYVNSA